MNPMDQLVADTRHASRQMVRELGFLGHAWGPDRLSHSACHALIELDRHGPLTVSDISSLLRIDRSTASRLITDLIRRGWTRSEAGESDRRQKRLHLTEAGRLQLQRVDADASAQVSRALESLDPAEREAAVLGLKLYAKALTRSRIARDFEIRAIRPGDDRAVARIIRTVMPEFGAVGCGFAINDPEVSHMSRAYENERSAFFVVTHQGDVVGCGGIAPLAGGDPDVCELRKMYFLPETRGHGLGRRLIELCIDAARQRGYRVCYLETLDSMIQAQKLYQMNGFRKLDGPMGDTGHFSCNLWYARTL